MLVGWEMPNRTDGTITPEEWQRFDALKPTVCKARPYNLRPENLNYIAAAGVKTVIIRPSADGDIDVEARVNDLQPAIVQLLQWGFSQIVVLPDSEPNLHNRPCPPDYWQKVSQVVAHPALIGLWGEKVKIASPPMAVAQGEPEWYEAGRDIIPAFDFLPVHLYGQLNPVFVHRALGLAHQFQLPIIADEVGDSSSAGEEEKARAVASYLQIAADSGVEMATLFMLGGTSEWSNFYFSPDVIARIIRPAVETAHA
jgi:hypothetical protein